MRFTCDPKLPGARVVDVKYIVQRDDDPHGPDPYEYSPGELEAEGAQRTPDPDRGPCPRHSTCLEVAARPVEGQAAEPINSVRSAA